MTTETLIIVSSNKLFAILDSAEATNVSVGGDKDLIVSIKAIHRGATALVLAREYSWQGRLGKFCLDEIERMNPLCVLIGGHLGPCFDHSSLRIGRDFGWERRMAMEESAIAEGSGRTCVIMGFSHEGRISSPTRNLIPINSLWAGLEHLPKMMAQPLDDSLATGSIDEIVMRFGLERRASNVFRIMLHGLGGTSFRVASGLRALARSLPSDEKETVSDPRQVQIHFTEALQLVTAYLALTAETVKAEGRATTLRLLRDFEEHVAGAPRFPSTTQDLIASADRLGDEVSEWFTELEQILVAFKRESGNEPA